MKPKILFTSLLALLVSGCAGQKSLQQHDALTRLDPVMGDWQGFRTQADGSVAPVVAQIIALGNGRYEAIIRQRFDSREPALVVLQGRTFGNTVRFTGKSAHGLLHDTEWQAETHGGNLSGTYSGRFQGSFELERTLRLSPTLSAPPPPGAVVLFDGTPASLQAWQHPGKTPLAPRWQVHDGFMEVTPRSGSLVSTEKFTDFHLHLEFRTPFLPSARGQARGNSGVYLQGRYEVQVLDSYGLQGRDNECGGIYKVGAPRVNMAAPPGQWQTYDITFHAARFDSSGRKIANARATVLHNGVVIHEDIEIPGPTGGELDRDEHLPGPLMLQDHGDRVAWRNIWIMPLPYSAPLSAQDSLMVRQLRAGDSSARETAVQSLRERRVYAAAGALLSLLADSSAHLRAQTRAALSELAGHEHVPAILRRLQATESEAERSELAELIATIELRHPVEQERGEALRAMRSELSKDDRSRYSLYLVNARLGDLSVLSALKKGLEHYDSEVRISALRALAAWPNAEPMPLMWRILQQDDDSLKRAIAFEGYLNHVSLATHRKAWERAELLQRALVFAGSHEQKKRILTTLSGVHDRQALRMAADFFDQPELRGAAAAAILAIAGHTADTSPRDTHDILNRVAAEAGSDSLQQRARELIRWIERFDDHLSGWEISGPYTGAEDLFEAVFAPERSGTTVQWQPVPDSSDSANPWLVPLDRLLGGENRVAYLRTRFWSDAAQPARLEVGSDDGVKVWLNGELVHANKVYRGVTPAEDKIPVQLRKGWNEVLLKVIQAGGGWGASMRVRSPEGDHLAGIRQ